MGSKRVQDEDIDRMIKRWARHTAPAGLEDAVVRETGLRKDAVEPIPVRAKVPVQVSYVETRELPGQVVAWTSKAVLVKVTIEGALQYVWLWGGAVERV